MRSDRGAPPHRCTPRRASPFPPCHWATSALRPRAAAEPAQRPPPEPAWRTKPAWYLVARDDHMIPPPAQHSMAERIGAQTVEVPGSHSVYVSQPAATADLIKQATRG
ncbi:alpha/beta fold hydrolase [Streptomyces sp. NPDC048496]|uniref:alpha/beta fold hydrolase n=1 Tax=Streptomyces sp. NPDC048496 TaxID=3365558 RepID=UPI00371858F6